MNNLHTLDSKLYLTAANIMVARTRLAEALNAPPRESGIDLLQRAEHHLQGAKHSLEDLIYTVDCIRLDLIAKLQAEWDEGRIVMQEQQREQDEASD